MVYTQSHSSDGWMGGVKTMKDASYLAHSPAANHWHHVGIRHHHGVAVPLFSLHSAHSSGIGEFPDLLLLADWCASIGFDLIQLLPLNDTGHGISPYSAVSAFALNPVFLSLSKLPYLEEYPFLNDEAKTLPKFSQTPHVDYAHVSERKEHFLRLYYQASAPRLLASEAYHNFLESASWLKGYTAFKILKQRHHGASWEIWPEKERTPTPELLETLAAEEADAFDWYGVLQFLCDQQLQATKEGLAKRKVFLMGDMPILIDRDSADVWLHQELFDLRYSAGAPPDMFTEDGQNWGFPLYNWSVLADHDYGWWRARLKWAARYYHLYRIDHIVGFFRIWAIPLGLRGKDGQFIPADEGLWIDHGQRLMLMMLDACDMLPIGEDLGIVPPQVRACLSALCICGTRVMRWERAWHEDGRFILPYDYSIDSMTTVSTHDSETLQLWWKNNPIESQKFAQSKGWSYQPLLSREYHREILWDSHHSASLFHINPIQEYLALFPGLSWPDLNDERINIPGIFSDVNWRYRLRLSLEELTNQETIKHLLQELIK